MSRIGKKPIPVPSNVKVTVAGGVVTVESGPKKLSFTPRKQISVRVDDQTKSVVVGRGGDDRQSKALHGLTRALIANMVVGVTTGFAKELEINGVGWSAAVQGQKIALKIGFADTRFVPIPTGVTVEVQGTKIKVKGTDKQAVGQVAARIRSLRPPEPYNGKGIKYADERIVRKAGKAFAGGGA